MQMQQLLNSFNIVRIITINLSTYFYYVIKLITIKLIFYFHKSSTFKLNFEDFIKKKIFVFENSRCKKNIIRFQIDLAENKKK